MKALGFLQLDESQRTFKINKFLTDWEIGLSRFTNVLLISQ